MPQQQQVVWSRPTRGLNMDNIVSSQPELGPSPPDGGFGWIVLLCAVVTQLFLTSITSVYGAMLLFSNLQTPYEEGQVFYLWDNNIVMVPILGVVFSLLMEPWGSTFIPIANSPRLVAISGVLFTGAGVILSNFSIENTEDEKIFNTFSGILIGFGSMLTLQQTEVLLSHYFRGKLDKVMTIYRLCFSLGSIIVPIFISQFCQIYGLSTTILIFAGIILQNCIIVMTFSRPVYIVSALQQNYNILHVSEDEDEEIYASQSSRTSGEERSYQNEANPNPERSAISERIVSAMVDEQDEQVIGSFNSEHTVKTIAVLETPVILRMDPSRDEEGSRNENRVIERFENISQSLYRETTVSNQEPREDLFTYSEPTTGTTRRTAAMKKNMIILNAIIKDPKFYGHTVIHIGSKFTSLIIYLLFPAFMSQQIPKMEYSGVIMATVVSYIGSACLNVISGFLAHTNRRKVVMRLNILTGSISLYGLSLSTTKSLLVLFGVLATFSTNSIFVLLQPISKKSIADFDKSAIHMISSCAAGFFCLLLTFVHNHSYFVCFYIASGMQLVAFIMSFLL